MLHELKIENFQNGIGIAEKTYKARRDRWGGNVNPQIPILTPLHML